MADKYGIPAGGDAYPGKVRYFHDNKRTLTARELLAVMKEAGWPEGSRTLAAAVALAESNGCPFVYNTYKKGHFGLFQISRSAWPEFFEGGSDQWADPVANAKKALEIKNSSGWKAWEGYTNDRWTKYKNEVAAAALEESRGRPFGPGLLGDIKEKGLSAVLGGAVDAIGDAASGVAENTADALGLDILSDVWEQLTTPAFWMRVAYGATGIALVVGGLFLIVRNTPAGKAAGKAAGAVANVTPVGRAASVAKGAAK
ncbi:hypothetical protein [Streptomyces luteogriseus]|uniref:hypothetical protein n=1 Tax=Streptomyces luteogriseus TaxID=68233 RepID=UPI00260B2479|nr:hypothetical protein [uncultured Streptomyces sp.]